jgi:hypothetical protein
MLIVGLWQGRRQLSAYIVDKRGRARELSAVEFACSGDLPRAAALTMKPLCRLPPLEPLTGDSYGSASQ